MICSYWERKGDTAWLAAVLVDKKMSVARLSAIITSSDLHAVLSLIEILMQQFLLLHEPQFTPT